MRLLEKDQYCKVAGFLDEVVYNHLFASAVVDHKIDGLIYTDNSDTPTSFYMLHPYGMSLLLGNFENKEFNKQLVDYFLNIDQSRKQTEWMQVYPEGWSTQLQKLLGNKILTKKKKEEERFHGEESFQVEEQVRVNFKFNRDKYNEFRLKFPRGRYDIVRSAEQEFQNMPGTVVPKFFWSDTSHFLKEGIGFSLYCNRELACTAFSSFINDHHLELGIESSPQFRGKGFAMQTCSALIDYSLENNYEPVWSCRLENTGSYLLAQKLGFEPVRFHPFYKVNV